MSQKQKFPIRETNFGFTILELLIVIAIIGVLAGIISFSIISARIKGRDAKRVGDMRQTITSLEQYRVQYGTYPTGTASVASAGSLLSDPGAFDSTPEPFSPNYLPLLPTAPAPADGPCLGGSGFGNNNYWYQTNADGDTYTLTFCLGKDSESWPSGTRTATPNGVQ